MANLDSPAMSPEDMYHFDSIFGQIMCSDYEQILSIYGFTEPTWLRDAKELTPIHEAKYFERSPSSGYTARNIGHRLVNHYDDKYWD
jgi:hypothetical protein